MKKKKRNNWPLIVTILAFTISLLFSFMSESVMPKVGIIVGIMILILFIFIGIIFDMIGVAVTSSNEEPLHAMSSKKIKGAKKAVSFKKNADKVSSFCNDVVGDICGIISGSTGAVIASKISSNGLNSLVVTIITMGIISALTIGGKAMEKSIAINKSNKILYTFAKVLSIFKGRHYE